MRIGAAIQTAVAATTKDWTKFQKRVIRSYGRATWRAPRQRRETLKDLAWRIMRQAYEKAAGHIGMAAPRQIFYAARKLMLAELDENKTINSVYFTQTLLPDYMHAHPMETTDWDLLWDDRGHFEEPHTDYRFGLGTLAVREYLANCQEPLDTSVTVEPLAFDYPTKGPRHRYSNVLLVEKEGFRELLKHVNLDTRFDLAIMSSKGMNTTAARTLVEKLPGVRFLVLHDFDKAGFSILGTLTKSTRRYHFERLADIVDLGVRLADVEAEGLESEPVSYPSGAADNLRRNGATPDEIEFLVGGGQRVELNAFTSDDFIAWIEKKLQMHGVAKLIPDASTLEACYRRVVFISTINDSIDAAEDDARAASEAVPIPESLVGDVRALLEENPTLSWDAAVAQLVSTPGPMKEKMWPVIHGRM
jgi:hypothetical protein